MRYARAKAARKTLQHFARTTGLKPPYSILLDATLVAALFVQKILPIRARVDRVLQTTGAAGDNYYCITQSAVEELRLIHAGLKTKNHVKEPAFAEALEWIDRECHVLTTTARDERDDDNDNDNHNGNGNGATTTKAQREMLRRIQEPDEEQDHPPYVVATQDEGLLSILRRMGSVAIVRLANSSVLILENPSKQSQRQFLGMERQKWKQSLPKAEKALVDMAHQEQKQRNKQNNRSSKDASTKTSRNRTKAKGPNPLSCKRKQESTKNSNEDSNRKKRRSRAKKRKTEQL